MITIRLLNSDFEVTRIILAWASLIWHRKYYNVGNFQITLDPTYFLDFKNAKYVYVSSEKELGVITTIKYAQNADNDNVLTVDGYFFTYFLKKRGITSETTRNGTAENIARNIVNTEIINRNNFDNFSLGSVNNVGTNTSLTTERTELYAQINDMLITQELSQHTLFNFDTKQLTYEIWRGLDRTDNQTDNVRAVFSDSRYNVVSASYSSDTSNYYNYVILYNEDNDVTTQYIYDFRISSDDDILELIVSSNLRLEDYTDESELELALKQKASDSLVSYIKVENFNGEVLIENAEFDLGDLVTFRSEVIGLQIESRITEIEIINEDNTIRYLITFGEPKQGIKQILNR